MFTYMYNIIIHIHIFTYGLPADWRLAFWRQSPFCQVVILPIYIYIDILSPICWSPFCRVIILHVANLLVAQCINVICIFHELSNVIEYI